MTSRTTSALLAFAAGNLVLAGCGSGGATIAPQPQPVATIATQNSRLKGAWGLVGASNGFHTADLGTLCFDGNGAVTGTVAFSAVGPPCQGGSFFAPAFPATGTNRVGACGQDVITTLCESFVAGPCFVIPDTFLVNGPQKPGTRGTLSSNDKFSILFGSDAISGNFMMNALIQTNQAATTASLNETISVSGMDVTVPTAVSGTLTFDGQGNVGGTLLFSLFGGPFNPQPVEAGSTYTVNNGNLTLTLFLPVFTPLPLAGSGFVGTDGTIGVTLTDGPPQDVIFMLGTTGPGATTAATSITADWFNEFINPISSLSGDVTINNGTSTGAVFLGACPAKTVCANGTIGGNATFSVNGCGQASAVIPVVNGNGTCTDIVNVNGILNSDSTYVIGSSCDPATACAGSGGLSVFVVVPH